ncbi:MAG TPA: DegQ family serine endoprotease [Usitatibacter sp.]|nr:DegQ family serine endoprotease [Usitatibacter sp.]
MRTKMLVGALVAAGVIGAGAATWHGHFDAPLNDAHAAIAPSTGVAAPSANPGSTALPLNGFTDLVKKYGPAVVNINVEGTRKVSSDESDGEDMPQLPPGLDEFFRGFGGGRGIVPHGAIPMRGQGSGFIISPDGYILTNAHVVENADRVTVKLTDRREFRAKVIGKDRQTDVALIKIDAGNLPTVRLGNSKDANVGEWVVAIGSPFGFDNSVTAGIVSAKGRSLPDSSYVPFIQTDVAVNPGNSGGPLFNLSGEVIGINSQIFSRTGAFAGISFAIPIETALNVKDQLLKTGHVSHGRIGITVQEVNAGLAESFGLDRPRGALVSSVEPGSPGDKAGLKAGDIILKYDGKPIERSGDLPVIVGQLPAGHTASVEVWRNHGSKDLTVATAEANKDAKVARNDGAAAHGKLGIAVRPLTPEERSEIKSKSGVVVEQVNGAAERAGIMPGDVVLSINGVPVKSPEDLRNQVAKSGHNAALLIQREDRQLFVPVEIG